MLAEKVNCALVGLQGEALGHQRIALESTLRLHNDGATRRVATGIESGQHAHRPRCEVLPMLSRTDQDGKCESTSIASKKPESELVRVTLGEVGQRGMSVEADPVWRIVAAASVAAIYGTLPRGA